MTLGVAGATVYFVQHLPSSESCNLVVIYVYVSILGCNLILIPSWT